MPITTIHQVQALTRGRRKSLGRTQQEVADQAAVSRKWLSDFERGATTSVELPLLLKVLAALDLTIEISPEDQAGTAIPDAEPEVDLDLVLAEYRERGARGQR